MFVCIKDFFRLTVIIPIFAEVQTDKDANNSSNLFNREFATV